VTAGRLAVRHALVVARLHVPLRLALAVPAGDRGRAVLRRYGFALPGDSARAAATRDTAARDTTRR